MITSIRLVNFKNFKDETLHLGPFTVLVGANASGKSNIRDAFRFLHGIGKGYTLAEIIGGKSGDSGLQEWQPIRGANNEIIRFGKSSFAMEIEMKLENGKAKYFIEIEKIDTDKEGQNEFRIMQENLETAKMSYTAEKKIFPASNDRSLIVNIKNEKGDVILNYDADSASPILGNILNKMLDLLIVMVKDLKTIDESNFEDNEIKLQEIRKATDAIIPNRDRIEDTKNILSQMRFLDISPSRARESSISGQKVLADNGENLPIVLKDIYEDSERRKILTSWLNEFTPMDVEQLGFPSDSNTNRMHIRLHEKNGREVSSYSASDGTLRFLAMLATLVNENQKHLYFFEEIENGIHPARQWLLLELIERQVTKGTIQVITTTHSPELLNYANEHTFEGISVVSRPEESADAIIRRVADLPNARDLYKSQGVGRLLAEGWIENMLAFSKNISIAEETNK